MTQAEFAAKLEMAQNSYSKIELGDNALTDKNIFLICLIYSVNETWLRTGKGEMFDPVSKPKDDDEKQLLEMFRRLSPERGHIAAPACVGATAPAGRPCRRALYLPFVHLPP